MALIFITSPSLNQKTSLSGVSASTAFTIENNKAHKYIHFELGKRDQESRSVRWLLRFIKNICIWIYAVPFTRNLIVHYNLPLNKPALIRDLPFIFYVKLFRRKLIVHLHGGSLLMDESPTGFISKLLNILFNSGTPIIVLSNVEKLKIKSEYPESNVFVLPNSISFNRFPRTILPPVSGKALNILYFGRIVSSKGFEYIYEALLILKEKNIPFNFLLAGDGPLLNKFLDLLNSEFGNSFHYLGIVTGDDKYLLFNECQVYLLPSISGEGLPIALLETMSSGLVPIVTTNGSMGAIVKNNENGLIVPPHDSNAIASAIIQLTYSTELLVKLSSESILSIKTNFDPEIYIKDLNKIYTYA